LQSLLQNLPSQEAIQAELARRGLLGSFELPRKRLTVSDFKEFVLSVNPKFIWYPHCEHLADILLRVANGDLKRVMIFMPPRHSKSEMFARLFPAFYLKHNPSHFVGLNSYASELAYTLSRAARENFKTAKGQTKDDADAVKHWETSANGGMWAAGVGSSITGKGFHIGIIDDPVKNAEDAASEIIQKKHQEWYASTFYTRAEPDAAIIIIQTRWNERDLSGWLLNQEGSEDDEPEHWHIVNFPAIKEELAENQFPSTCTIEDDFRENGQPLCDARYPKSKLEKIKQRIGSYYWAALYQQRPKAREGNLFKLHYFKEVQVAPQADLRVRYWDLGGSDSNKADYSVGLLMSRTDDDFYTIEDVVRGQWSPQERNAQILRTAEKDEADFGNVRLFIERAPGLAVEVIDTILRLLAQYGARADSVNKDKVTRADPFAAQLEAGFVQYVKAVWNRAFFDELLVFPNGLHDDQVDGTTGAFNKLAVAVRWQGLD